MGSSEEEPEPVESPTPSGAADEASAPVDFAARAYLPFPVVGIGSSAGGVEALRKFFAATEPDTGMAFVVIQHLAPDHLSLMEEILGRCTSMPVREIEDGVAVEIPGVLLRYVRHPFLDQKTAGRVRAAEAFERHR
jgi:two-component system, chemotaxis family, CheB/CheR fusion protein